MLVFILSILFIITDQVSKFMVTTYLRGQPPKSIIGEFFQFYYLENTGAAFGILKGSRTIFFIITIIVLFVLFGILLRDYHNTSTILKISFALIIGGTIGNFIDRIRLHYVVDFISIKIFDYNFAIFNLADTYIVLGTFLLMIIVLLHENPKR
ncbi:MAG: signal peptidase II [Tissierellia bacterium]|nr:signal peptidase II [Tissierellia bacterium]